MEDHHDPETEVKHNEPVPNLTQEGTEANGVEQQSTSTEDDQAGTDQTSSESSDPQGQGDDEEVVDDDPEDPLEEPVQGDDESDEDFASRRRSWSAKKAARTRAENRATETQ